MPIRPLAPIRRPPAPARGATLVELALALVVAGMLAGIALPRAAAAVDRIHVRGAITELSAAYATARHFAVMRAAFATVELDPGSATVAIHAGGDTIHLRRLGAQYGVTMSASRTSTTYTPIGLGFGAGNATIVVSRGRAADTVWVSRLGRVRTR